MSRIGKLSIKIPSEVSVGFSNNIINIKGPMGFLSQYINPSISTIIEKDQIFFKNNFLKEKKCKS